MVICVFKKERLAFDVLRIQRPLCFKQQHEPFSSTQLYSHPTGEYLLRSQSVAHHFAHLAHTQNTAMAAADPRNAFAPCSSFSFSRSVIAGQRQHSWICAHNKFEAVKKFCCAYTFLARRECERSPWQPTHIKFHIYSFCGWCFYGAHAES